MGDISKRSIIAITTVIVCVGYSLGYLLIDVFQWVVLTPDQLRDGYIHMLRVFTGLFVMAVPVTISLAWKSRMDIGV